MPRRADSHFRSLLARAVITAMVEDGEGTLWIGTKCDGLVRVRMVEDI